MEDWNNIKNKFKDPEILLGNGFSISFSGQFIYDSIFKIFLNKVPEPFKTYFSNFKTTNFEQILMQLQNAVIVNDIFGLKTDEMVQSIELIKAGLISSIQEVHPSYSQIDKGRIQNISEKLKDYGNIYTTNYDILLYHIIMSTYDINKRDSSFIKYQDYFWNKLGDRYLQFMDTQGYKSKDVYYLHGSLFIYHINWQDLKIKRNYGDPELLNTVAEEISSNNLPLFVAEGDSGDKMSSIRNNRYLSFCFNKFSISNKPLLIFGHSLSHFDNHIINAIKERERPLILTLYTNKKTDLDLEKEKDEFRSKFSGYQSTIVFVDSATVF